MRLMHSSYREARTLTYKRLSSMQSFAVAAS